MPKPNQLKRREFLRSASMAIGGLPLSLDLLVLDTAQREEPIYSINLDEEILSYDNRDKKTVIHDISQDSQAIRGTLDEIREEFRFLVARGKIPDVRHIYPRVEEMAQLMSRDRHYLANPENGFKFIREGYWSPKSTDGVEKKEIDGFPLNYKKENLFIGGVYYDLFLWLVGRPLNEGSVVIKDLFDFGVVPSVTGNKDARIKYYWTVRPGQNYEEYIEQRLFSTGRWLHITSTLRSTNSATLPSEGDSLIYMLDFSGTIQPLIKSPKKASCLF